MSDTYDIAPELLERIQKEFKKSFQQDKTIKEIYGLIENGLVSYEKANQFSIRCGELLSQSYLKYLNPETLPEGRLWFNIAEKIIEPTLSQNYDLITEVCSYAQENVNKLSGVSIKYIQPEINQNRIDGFVEKVSSYDDFDKAQWMLKEPVVNYSQSVVDDSIKTNAEFHAKSGLTPKLKRTLDNFERRVAIKGKRRVSYTVPCKWCNDLAGIFDYYDAPKDIYRRHENCRCTVEYIRDGKTQDVWSKDIWNYVDDDVQERINQQTINDYVTNQIEKDVRIKGDQVDFYGGLNGKILPAKYKEWIGINRMQYYLNILESQEAKQVIKTDFRPTSFIGNGDTFSVRKFEKATGLNCGRNGGTHSQKVDDLIRQINKTLLLDISENDKVILRKRLEDLLEVQDK